MLRKILAALLLILVLAFGVTGVALATALPDSVSIDVKYVNRHLLQTNDMLIVAQYNLAYTVTPNETATETFFFRLFDTDNVTELGATVPYAYSDSGYGKGVVSFYFDNTTAPTWGLAYTIRVTGSPVHFTTPPVQNAQMSAGDYTTLTTQDGNQLQLRDRIISIAHDLETAWATTLTTETDFGTCLDDDGEAYFRYAIPQLQYMAPDVFSVQTLDPTYSERSWGNATAAAYQGRFTGTWVQDSMDALGQMFTINAQLAMGIPVAIICIAILVANALVIKDNSAILSGLIDSWIVILCGTLLGWVSMAVMSTLLIVTSIFAGFIAFVNRT